MIAKKSAGFALQKFCSIPRLAMTPGVLFMALALFLPMVTRAQFDQQIIEKCNSCHNDTACLQADQAPYFDINSCFPHSSNQSFCKGMIIGQLDRSKDQISWLMFIHKRVNSTACISFVPKDIDPSSEAIFYCPEEDKYIKGGEILVPDSRASLFTPVREDMPLNLTSHWMIPFDSSNEITFKMNASSVQNVNLDDDPVIIHFLHYVNDPKADQSKIKSTKEARILFGCEPQRGIVTKSFKNIELIIGLLVGGLAVLILFIIVVVIVIKQRNKKKKRRLAMETFPTVQTLPSEEVIANK